MDKTNLLAKLRTLLSEQIRTDHVSLETFGKDWTGIYPPRPLAVALPRSIADLQALVGFANDNQIGLVPSGGRTGLSGGAVAANSEIVVSFRDFNRILEFDKTGRSVRVEAGVITRDLQDFSTRHGLYFPVEFASSGSSQIGGNIATNAGGIRVIRYGPIRDWVTGVKVVTGRGDVLDLNKGLTKNATGYDLRHLFIGSEGTLGLIAEATLRLTSPPGPRRVILFGLSRFFHILDVLSVFQDVVKLNAFEFFCNRSLTHVLASQGVAKPFTDDYPFYSLIDFEFTGEAELNKATNKAEHVIEQGWAQNAVIAQDEKDCARLWVLRESITESIAPLSPYKNDISVIPARVPTFLADIENLVLEEYPDFTVLWFGHIGDGNVHLNILRPPEVPLQDFVRRCESVNEKIFRVVEIYEGSISAEHGVGLLKKRYLRHSRSEIEISSMREIKAVFDPKGILNPGKLFND